MNRILATTALLLVGMLGITGCASEQPAAESSESTESAGTEQKTGSDTAEQNEAVAPAMPDGARPGSADFPFPVPADWAELAPFAEEKIGKDIAMYAMFEYPGDAASASDTYQRLLEEAGYTIHPNPLGEQVHAASFIAEGEVDGVAYAGTLDFDTDAGGTPRVTINLAQD